MFWRINKSWRLHIFSALVVSSLLLTGTAALADLFGNGDPWPRGTKIPLPIEKLDGEWVVLVGDQEKTFILREGSSSGIYDRNAFLESYHAPSGLLMSYGFGRSVDNVLRGTINEFVDSSKFALANLGTDKNGDSYMALWIYKKYFKKDGQSYILKKKRYASQRKSN